ncbi:hypothetical protein [Rosistilla oblonga]|uniref:hypothetical protein n=2 Tax=Rosistilla oblonga TaxID=2527990 RepID=UPI003A9745A0
MLNKVSVAGYGKTAKTVRSVSMQVKNFYSSIRTSFIVASLLLATLATAQQPQRHRLFNDNMPPGAIGQFRRDLRGPVQCQYQPVKITAEGTAKVSLAIGNMFQADTAEPVYAGFELGNVYRIRITEIPLFEGYEIYPTIELIDRVYPPAGQEVRFAIPIVISNDDMLHALRGNLVTRVIYLEDPSTALPIAETPGEQRDFDIQPHQDALDVADTLGRPVAIIRYGSRTPPSDPTYMNAFLMGCPYWLPLQSPRTEALTPEGQTAAIRTPHIPRDDVPTQVIPSTEQTRIARPYALPIDSGVVR